jgi:hypothetical protein
MTGFENPVCPQGLLSGTFRKRFRESFRGLPKHIVFHTISNHFFHNFACLLPQTFRLSFRVLPKGGAFYYFLCVLLPRRFRLLPFTSCIRAFAYAQPSDKLPRPCATQGFSPEKPSQ